MHASTTRWVVAALAVTAGLAHAEDPSQRQAREELERQLRDMVGTNPARLRVDFVALDEPNYRLEEAAFELDGKGLLTPLAGALEPEGRHEVYFADVKPGRHTLGVKLVYASSVSPVMSDEGGYKWNLGGTLSWVFQAGIEVHVTLTAVREASAKAIKDRVKLTSAAVPVMFARLDDGKMPEPPPKPKLEEDAGVQVAEAGKTPQQLAQEERQRKAEEAAEAKQAAAEERQRKAEEAAEAKRAAAEERQRKAEEAAEAKRAAAEERRRKAAEAAETRRAAAEEKKRRAQEAAGAKKAAAEEKQRQAEEAAGAKKAAEAEQQRLAEEAAHPAAAPDAGPVAVAVAEPVDAGAPRPVAEAKPEPPAEGGPPWILIAAGALAVAGIFLFLIARRRANPRVD